jgi:hypothetical protein
MCLLHLMFAPLQLSFFVLFCIFQKHITRYGGLADRSIRAFCLTLVMLVGPEKCAQMNGLTSFYDIGTKLGTSVDSFAATELFTEAFKTSTSANIGEFGGASVQGDNSSLESQLSLLERTAEQCAFSASVFRSDPTLTLRLRSVISSLQKFV